MALSTRGKKSNSFMDGLKTEWSLFWDTLLGDEDEALVEEVLSDESQAVKKAGADSKDPFVTGKIETLSLEKIKTITKALSQDRKKLNQKLESLNKELDLNAAKLESLRLVGAGEEETRQRIHELSDLGQNLSEKLNKINDRIKIVREVEDRIKENLKA